MNINLPSKVSAGDTLSAKWMNTTADALKKLSELVNRRRLLAGSGYSLKESSGGTSLTIERQSQFLRGEHDFPFYSNIDFTVRLKPIEQSKEDQQGNWERILQVHKGHILNHLGESIRVEGFEETKEEEGEAETPAPEPEPEESIPAWDSENWVDIEVELGKEPLEIYVKTSLDAAGNPTTAYFCTEEKDDGFIYIPIALLEVEIPEKTAEEDAETKYYLTQYHLGSIEIGGSAKAMPFDASVALIEHECADIYEQGGTEVPEPEYRVLVEEGRVFLPEAKHAIIPAKEGTPFDSETALEAKDGYLLLELTMTAEGKLEYQYRIADKLPSASVEVIEKAPEQENA